MDYYKIFLGQKMTEMSNKFRSTPGLTQKPRAGLDCISFIKTKLYILQIILSFIVQLSIIFVHKFLSPIQFHSFPIYKLL